MRDGQAIGCELQSARAMGWGIRFFLTAALTAARLPGGGAPLALGCAAAAGSGGEGAAALLGAAVGTLLFLDFSAGLPQLASAILIAAAATAFRGLRLTEKRFFPSLCAAAFVLAVKGIYVLQSSDPASALPLCLTETALAAFSAYGYAPLLSRGREAPGAEGLWFSAVTLLCAFSGVEAGGLSVGRTALGCLVLAIGWRQGVTRGTVTGLLSGILMDFYTGGGTLVCAAAYAFAGMLSGSCAGKRRVSVAPRYLLGESLLLAGVRADRGWLLLLELLGGCVLFLLLPGRAFGGKRLSSAPAQGESSGAAVEKLKAHLSKTAAALHDLSDSLGRSLPRDTEESPAVIFDRAAESVCRDCALCTLCWQKEYVSTFDALNNAAPFLMERGRALAKDFPSHFADRCIHLSDLLGAINRELSAYLLRRQYRRELEETRRSARGQYAQLGELLSATAAELGEARPVSARRRTYRIGAALRPRAGESVCGDSVTSFETERGRLCLLVSDGSGSGESARRESALTSRLLRQFLEAGIEPEAALKTLNTALALRSEETGAFATIDLLTVEPDAAAALYKYGAAPTYLKKGGSVRRITGNALPPGLREAPAPPDVTRLKLEEGSFTVMISDGVADALDDEWLQNLLAGWDGEDPQALAGLVLRESAQRGRMEDDCGVQVLAVPAGEGNCRRA